ncbi:SPOR domain-containing protein [bacterium]|nr:SPOR domain-containing protein [bacterium]
MRSSIIMLLTMLVLVAGCSYLPTAKASSTGKTDTSEVKQLVLQEVEDVPDVVVEPRSEPPKPIEYQSLAEHYLPEERPAEGSQIRGFRVQLFTTKSSASADSFVVKAKKDFEFNVYCVFEPPYYKVRAGDFADQFEASEAESKMKSKGYETFIVRDIIKAGE